MKPAATVAAGVLAATMPASAAIGQVMGSWGIACGKTAGSPCIATQLVAADPRGKKVVLGVILVRGRGLEPSRMVLRVGPDIDRKAGFGLKLSTGAELRLPVDRCGPTVCEGSGRLTSAIRAQLGRAPVAQVAWRLGNGKQMLVPVNLRDFARALAVVEKGNPRNVYSAKALTLSAYRGAATL